MIDEKFLREAKQALLKEKKDNPSADREV